MRTLSPNIYVHVIDNCQAYLENIWLESGYVR